ncbi:MAG TPA: hypothetical protein VHY79_07295 [Rhizomicrobium sp.]|jgi:hypothetical protein|nr:hypothetical protein [Rhizomicrobium sp.]
MDAFSYLSVLNSIVLGLGVASLLAGFASMVRARDRVVMYWPLPAQMGLVFLIHVQLWWALFALRERTQWSFPGFLVVLMQPVLAYLAAAFLVPDIRDGEALDLKWAYFREARWFFAAVLLLVLDSLAKSLILGGRLPNSGDLAGHAVFISLSVAGIVSRKDIVHKIIAPASLLALAAYIATLFVTLR